MIIEKKRLIIDELEKGTGAVFDLEPDTSGIRSAMKVWFAELGKNGGPIASLKPYGLKGHKVTLSFGSFAGGLINQIQRASAEDIHLARALVDSIDGSCSLEIAGQERRNWCVADGSFLVEATVRDLNAPNSDAAVVKTCREIIIPLMAAMAELIGYDVIEEPDENDIALLEGAIKQSVVTRRERNPRSRLLCVRMHGYDCTACGKDPRSIYGSAGDIIEVHHLEPLSLLNEPKPYDPKTDLVPLCPSCHRAVHSRRPIPWSIEEIRNFLETQNG
ncbi:HNH endonuclease [Ruegeria sp. HKCCA6707]|uniref:HNH endonuclease n=1 Tax=Ruegeria sp. HKCCA6707 TaxID=2682996 RepID=UPI001488A7BD|nr:HNH endonuclease [Ruegeria sp. HKCCA6707]